MFQKIKEVFIDRFLYIVSTSIITILISISTILFNELTYTLNNENIIIQAYEDSIKLLEESKENTKNECNEIDKEIRIIFLDTVKTIIEKKLK